MNEDIANKLIKLAEWIITIDLKRKYVLPKPVAEMTADEHAIFQLAARYAGQFMFLVKEASSILSALDPVRLDALYKKHSPAEEIWR